MSFDQISEKYKSSDKQISNCIRREMRRRAPRNSDFFRVNLTAKHGYRGSYSLAFRSVSSSKAEVATTTLGQCRAVASVKTPLFLIAFRVREIHRSIAGGAKKRQQWSIIWFLTPPGWHFLLTSCVAYRVCCVLCCCLHFLQKNLQRKRISRTFRQKLALHLRLIWRASGDIGC